jgi:hypothetical protein
MSLIQIPQSAVEQIQRDLLKFVLNPKPRIQSWFSNLQPGSFEIIGNPTEEYNCIAWAAGDKSQYWWPGMAFWPDGVPEELTFDTFMQAFASIGYNPCDNECFEQHVEKVAIYLKNGQPSHAARQARNGRWTSKLGPWELIEHDFDALEGNGPNEYGQITQIIARPMASI